MVAAIVSHADGAGTIAVDVDADVEAAAGVDSRGDKNCV